MLSVKQADFTLFVLMVFEQISRPDNQLYFTVKSSEWEKTLAADLPKNMKKVKAGWLG